MANWVTISSLATGAGTLVLAVATFSAVRSANRSATLSERSFLGANLPLLLSSRVYDLEEKTRFIDNVSVRVKGGHAYVAVGKRAVYFVISLRNAGQGLAVLDRWRVSRVGDDLPKDYGPGDINSYRRLIRDLYVSPGDVGLFQGAIRDNKDPQFKIAADAIKKREIIHIDIEYTDLEGGQRSVSHFVLTPSRNSDWLSSASRHWRIDGVDPRKV
jgi:hypothetical protein